MEAFFERRLSESGYESSEGRPGKQRSIFGIKLRLIAISNWIILTCVNDDNGTRSRAELGSTDGIIICWEDNYQGYVLDALREANPAKKRPCTQRSEKRFTGSRNLPSGCPVAQSKENFLFGPRKSDPQEVPNGTSHVGIFRTVTVGKQHAKFITRVLTLASASRPLLLRARTVSLCSHSIMLAVKSTQRIGTLCFLARSVQ